MQVLILGNSKDPHAAHLQTALTQAGCLADYLDTSLFPTQIRMSWQADTSQGYISLPGGRRLDCQDIHSVFWRNFGSVGIPSLKDDYQQTLAFNDAMSVLRTFMQGTNIHWINSWRAYQFHKEKPLQLRKVQEIGCGIPATLIGNDPEAAIKFAASHEKVIFKPVYGGAHARLLEKEHLQPERLHLVLKISPITLQEYIPGTNIRSYVIGQSVYSAEIRTQSLDFREDPEAQLIPCQLPDLVQSQCGQIAQALWLEWTAIDWRLTPEGKYIFLEANPSPMFIHFEQQTNWPITKELVSLLMH